MVLKNNVINVLNNRILVRGAIIKYFSYLLGSRATLNIQYRTNKKVLQINILKVKDDGKLRLYILNPILKGSMELYQNTKLPIILIINYGLV